MKKLYLLATIFACAPSISAMETRGKIQDKIAEAKTIRANAPKGYTMIPPSDMPELYCAFCKTTIKFAYVRCELGSHIEQEHKRCGVCFIPITGQNDLLRHNREKHPDQLLH